MMSMCASRFEVEEQQLAFTKEFFSTNEIEAGIEEKEREEELDPISDNEEDDPITMVIAQPLIESRSPVISGRGQKRNNSGSQDEAQESSNSESEEDLPLPDIQQRISGRVRKRSRLLEGYEVNI